MRTLTRILFAAAGLILLAQAGPAADPPKAGKKAKQAQKLAEKLADQQKKAIEAQKAEAAKKAADAKKVAETRKDSNRNAAALKPALISGKKDARAVAAAIDAAIDAKLKEEKLPVSPPATDAEFLRRVYIDVIGVVPSAVEAKAFLDDTAADKRAKLIDKLLASKEFGRRQADVWGGLLIERNADNRRVDFSEFRPWLAGEFNANPGWDKTVTTILTAGGELEKNPATGFFFSNNTVDKMTDDACKLFLGVQLQCAQCHNHPFTTWKQTEYWAMAQFFLKTRINGVNKDATPSVSELADAGKKRNRFNELPESFKDVAPKYLQGPEAKITADPARPLLAKWLTGPTNPFFAKAFVNRTWSEFFGRGLVNPVDDMHDGNPATHPELLQALAADFSASGHDVKHFVRAICNSNAYQRGSKSVSGNEDDDAYYSRMPVKVLSPEQLYDSLAAVTGAAETTTARNRAVKDVKTTPRETFVTFFLAGAEQPNPLDYEAGIPQALRLMNRRIPGTPQAVKAFMAAGSAEKVFEQMFLTAVARRPSAAEVKKYSEYVKKAPTAAEGYGDVFWALLNSSEFSLNR